MKIAVSILVVMILYGLWVLKSIEWRVEQILYRMKYGDYGKDGKRYAD